MRERGSPDTWRLELERIIEDAESRCSVEFSVVLAKASDTYYGALSAGIFLFQGLGLLLVSILDLLDVGGQWHAMYSAERRAILLLISGVLGFLLFWALPSLRLKFVPRSTILKKVREAALAVFTEAGLYHTTHRRTVLVYLSEMEKRVDIVVDKGLAEILNENRIQTFEEEACLKMRRGFSPSIIEEMLLKMASFIAQNGFPPGPQPMGELSNAPDIR